MSPVFHEAFQQNTGRLEVPVLPHTHGSLRHVVNRAATALRLAATTLLRSHSYLGAQYRRLRGKLGAPKAITAMAHKLARLVYRMLKWGHEYVDKGLQYYEQRHREQQVQLLKKRATKLGLQIVEPDAA
jgi:transposase